MTIGEPRTGPCKCGTAFFFISNARGDKGASLQLSGRNEVHIAPDPSLSRLNGAHERVFRMMKVLGGVLVLRRVAAANIPTFEA
jgi:hypothetical protein